MAKKNSIFSGKKARKSSVEKFKESDLYKKIYGKTHEQRVEEYKEWKKKEVSKGYNLSQDTKGKAAGQRIDFLLRQLSDEDADLFREFYDEDDPTEFFELGQRVINGESVSSIDKELKDSDKLPTNFEG